MIRNGTGGGFGPVFIHTTTPAQDPAGRGSILIVIFKKQKRSKLNFVFSQFVFVPRFNIYLLVFRCVCKCRHYYYRNQIVFNPC